jgi:MoaA/NifB/PqqE/SkfB family radical SAM enzyme
MIQPQASQKVQVESLPRPEPDKELWNSILNAGFKTYPQRKENYEKYLRSRFLGTELDYLPVKMDIENVSRCNFRCTMCQVSDWKGGKRGEDMSLEQFKEFFEQQYGIVEIKLQGMGEPLMGKSFFEMIQYARSRHIWVRTTTNASLLHFKDNYKHLIDSDVCEIQISMDGASTDVYEKIRRGGKLEIFKRNVKMLNDYARSVNKLRTKMWVVVQRDNYHQLRDFPVIAGELGFNRLVFSLELTDWGQEKWAHTMQDIAQGERFDSELSNDLMELGKKNGVDVRFWYIDKKYDLSDPQKLCPWPWERAYVSSDMHIVPCCKVGNPDVFDLGNAENFTNEWNGKKYQAFRKMHLNGKLPFICKSCYKSQG